ncbi:CPBP family intramembrane metalloprotease [Haloarcula rubripromontorii]|uniref:CPBP family intramembrane metalloprotease n=1 Tax=Haloarcula rubripromontorii TaxID=1705562 RepID=A0A847U145_9EURY|nr:type II CAAX endopeptidase family protein [Haloarcula rubripromontorii]NLV06207.1 CPBP family intramembrane metalloprotease [Haloarcula rubripromontorii]
MTSKPLTETTSTTVESSIDHSLSQTQLRRGVTILLAFVVMRALLWGPLWTQPTPTDPLQYAGLVLVTILVGSVGLVYLGFTRWVGVDIVSWWVDRTHLRWDLLWGLAGFVIALLVTLGTALGFQSLLGPRPPNAPVAAAPSPVGTLLLLVFGFAVASFQEETLFRGFLQTELADRYGEWPAVVLQAGTFSVAHVGYYPFSAWYLFAAAFAGGLVYGWLRKRRGRLLVSGIAHGLLG